MNIKRSIFNVILLCLILFAFSGCTHNNLQTNSSGSTIADCRGNTYLVSKNAKVVSCYGSFSEMWLLSGGKLAGVTEDAISDHKLTNIDDASIVGTVKEINLEKVVSLNPDYVILSEDIVAHHQLDESLKTMNIPHGYFKVDSFDDYEKIMEQFCIVNQRPDLFEKNVVNIKENIDNILSNLPADLNKTFLTMRCYSTGIKVKNDNLANDMLCKLKATDICDKNPSLLKDFSLEQIISDDPDFIFVLTMGDE